jgi:hypothetical protein
MLAVLEQLHSRTLPEQPCWIADSMHSENPYSERVASLGWFHHTKRIDPVCLSGASTKFMQLSATWRCPIDDGVDVCDVVPKQMDDNVCSNKL